MASKIECSNEPMSEMCSTDEIQNIKAVLSNLTMVTLKKFDITTRNKGFLYSARNV